ncbi:MAG TPA: hypothetical protein VFN74_12860, partial [Chloroflexota bacterium]|nr:hypothetical protein [Chloroflexota bacterium]
MDVTLRPRDLERDAEPIANLLAAEVANGAPSAQELRLAAARTPAGALRHHVVAEAPADATGS